MSLMKCPTCRNDVSEKADACPHCGLPSPASQLLKESGKLLHGKYSETWALNQLWIPATALFLIAIGIPVVGICVYWYEFILWILGWRTFQTSTSMINDFFNLVIIAALFIFIGIGIWLIACGVLRGKLWAMVINLLSCSILGFLFLGLFQLGVRMKSASFVLCGIAIEIYFFISLYVLIVAIQHGWRKSRNGSG